MHESDAVHFAVKKKSNGAKFNQSDLLQIQASTCARRRNARVQDVDMLRKYLPENANNLPIGIISPSTVDCTSIFNIRA